VRFRYQLGKEGRKMFVATDTGLTLLAVGMLFVVLTAGNGAADPGSQAIVLLQKGNTAERREAVALLIRYGDKRAVQPLVHALRDADALVRHGAEEALWRIWHRSGDPEVDTRLREGILAMQRGSLQEAVEIFTDVIKMAPDFAEGYNKRATTYYLMQEYEKSLQDCAKTLERNPVHFGALSGTGLNYMGLRNPVKALEYFQRAIEVNPNMVQIREYIEEIKRFLRDQTL
jgi:tetratricopeptide (TPR) repeat protein